MAQLALFIGGAALAGTLFGLLSGILMAAKRYRDRLESLGEEVMRLKLIADGKLSEEDPDLPRLLRELNGAVEKTHRALDALERKSAVLHEKSKCATDVKKSVRGIVTMMEDMGANLPYVPESRVKAITASLAKPKPALEKAPPLLR